MTDTELKLNGFELLNEKFGEVLTERFIAILQREKFDYTKWQKSLWNDKSIEELSELAMKNKKK